MTFDQRAFRDALGCFTTGVAVVTAVAEGAPPIGITVNSFTSVSLDPPLVLICLARSAQSFDAFTEAEHFAISILAEDQQDLSVRFSRRDLDDRWAGVATERWDSGAPILTGALAAFECAREAEFDGGDHVILVGRVLRLASQAGRPLLYARGRYAALA